MLASPLDPKASGPASLGRSLTLATGFGLFCAFLLIPPLAPFWLREIPAALALVLAIALRKSPGPEVGWLVLVVGYTASLPLGVPWPAPMPLALGFLALCAKRWPSLGAPRIERGRLLMGLTLFAGLVTPGALYAWVQIMKPDLSDLTSQVPALPLPLLILGGVGFAISNALFEEWIWRGVLQPRLTDLWGPVWAIALQALSFGIAHLWGFPRGLLGAALAGSWALLLGVVRHLSGGLLSVVLAHIVADAAIAAIVLSLAGASH